VADPSQERLGALLEGIVQQAEDDLAITRAMNLAPRLEAELADGKTPDQILVSLRAEGVSTLQIQIARDALNIDKQTPYYLKAAQERHKVRLQSAARNQGPPRSEPDMYVLPVEDKTQAQLEAVDVTPVEGDDGA